MTDYTKLWKQITEVQTAYNRYRLEHTERPDKVIVPLGYLDNIIEILGLRVIQTQTDHVYCAKDEKK